MTEKEKMLKGMLYKGIDEELIGERQYAKELLYDYNNLRPSKVEERNSILKKLLGKVGNNFYLEPPFRCDYGYNITIGDNFYANYNFIVLDCSEVTIGNNVMCGPNVSIFAAGHPLDAELRINLLEYGGRVSVGDNVWIGGNTAINAGVNIGNNVVIGSGSVVTKDIPDNSLAFGNPCRVYREITPEDKNFYFKKYPTLPEDKIFQP